jgi:hypothetical protein
MAVLPTSTLITTFSMEVFHLIFKEDLMLFTIILEPAVMDFLLIMEIKME